MDDLELKLCDIQGRLFELSYNNNVPSEAFIKTFMNSETAKGLDREFDRTQWMGEKYLFGEVIDSAKDVLAAPGETYDNETLYWTGYMYRFWHYYTGESSSEIIRQAPPEIMRSTYYSFHTLDPKLTIQNLKEIFEEKKNKRKGRQTNGTL